MALTSAEKVYWVIVADEATVIFYEQETKRSPLREFLSLKNESARIKTASLISDRSGRSFDSHGQGRHSMTKEKMDPKKRAATIFAKKIAARIVSAKQDGSCRDYALIAAPAFLGLLRDALAATGIAPPYLTIDKNVVSQKPLFIEKLLAG